MKKNTYMEIIGVLSLSLLITSTMAVSGGLPEILKDFSTYPRSTVETLMSVPTFSILVVIALTPMLSRYIKERTMIITGLLVIGIAGIIPVFVSSFPLIFTSRICLGAGIGLVNTSAVSMIGERFTGNLRQKLQGIRCSMETLGEASLIFIAGQLLIFGWNYSFLVYALAFVILFLYLVFVPEQKIQSKEAQVLSTSGHKTRKITTKERRIILQNALLGALLVSTLTANALRISSYVVESSLGTSVEGSTVLSISIFAGFLGGLIFGRLLLILKQYLLPISMLLVAAGLTGIVLSQSLFMVALTASICGFFSTIALSYMFNALSDHLPTDILNTANAIVLVGCNTGSFGTPFVLQTVGLINASLSAGFLAYAFMYALLSVCILLKLGKNKRKQGD